MLYGKQHLESSDKKGLVSFLRIANLMYMCRLIHSFLINIVMPRLGSRDYVSDKDRFCM